MLLTACSGFAQAIDDREFLQRATDRVAEYDETFHDLTAEETATFRFLDMDGRPRMVRTIVSSLIIYRAQADAKMSVEYRDVESVDGKQVKDHSKRAVKLLERITDARSAIDELERVTREGSRYNQNVVTINLTLHEGIPLMMKCRHAFTFRYVGDEAVGEIPTRVYAYTQVEPCDASHYKLRLPSEYERGEKWHEGRLWLERSSARIVREERIVYAQNVYDARLRAKVIIARFNYKPSSFGILVPSTIELTSYGVTRQVFKNGPLTIPRMTLTQSYGPFSKFDVSVQQHVVYPDTQEP